MANFSEATKAVSAELACSNCGAMLKFKPGTHHLACDYCGTQNEIAAPGGDAHVREINLEDFLAKNFEREERIEVATVKCNSCGATSTLDPNISSDKCPFCAASLVVQSGTTASIHKPHCVLPFGISDQNAIENFRRWLNKLWFAPNDLKQYGNRTD